TGNEIEPELRELLLKLAGVEAQLNTSTSVTSAIGTVKKETDRGQAKPVRFRTALRNTVVGVMRDRGWEEVSENEDWDFFWADVHWVHDQYDHTHLRDYQRINHFRNHYELTRKDLLVKNLKRTFKTVEREHGRAAALKFDFVTPTFVLPGEYALFQEEFRRAQGGVWIMKPVGKSQGKGIFLISKPSQIAQWSVRRDSTGKIVSGVPGKFPSGSTTSVASKAVSLSSSSSSPTSTRHAAAASRTAPSSPLRKTVPAPVIGRARDTQDEQEGPEAYIVQKYIEKPYLVGGKKFDIRTYVLVTSFNPLVVYIHRNGFCRFSNHQFSMDSKDINNLYIHATNVAIQKTSPNYNKSTAHGCKWLLRNLRQYISSRHGQAKADECFTEMEALMVRTLMSVQKVVINDRHCFELYGYDILLDENLKPWLLEVNASPSLSAETPWDHALKHNMLNDMFDVVDIEGRYNPAPPPPPGGTSAPPSSSPTATSSHPAGRPQASSGVSAAVSEAVRK
ncbi:putative tubulin polyglutamylase ttll9, partial [Gonapodya sp. JEL0774]